ncbi:MAG: hypothetical protein JWR17_396 [Pseudomonas sp.]|jgi:2-polyprenyl-3-methyl-5-hydroxy-6-metoxy-1,4-benzoquinol methylase|uniref:class I SAM-dependent methyltransferase n=1 Tax=Pseudomonas sp. TaxID=306 RepID=UPI00260D72F6|nr:class I SAM-dependent methyltransferase [Pseudomonas sp.]MDB6047650.1 hypothetical protein [Pseudomonas sp.]
MPAYLCPVCDASLVNSFYDWHMSCTVCGYEKSDLLPTINEQSAHEHIDESMRETGLRDLRVSNFRILLDVIRKFKSEGGRLLDVGCAHGWFVEQAMTEFDVLGVEPDSVVFQSAAARGLPVRLGYFPEALEASEKFDVIVFNDVIEHIPEIAKVVASCRDRLIDGGYLVINLPSSRGFFYKLSKLLARIGYGVFFERLWQKGLPSPHVHYFNEDNLSALLKRNNFTTMHNGRLAVLGLAGLHTRISYTGNMGAALRLIIYVLVAISLPVLRLLPSDIIYSISKKS